MRFPFDMRRLVYFAGHPLEAYRPVYVCKPAGGYREALAPCPELQEIQDWLVHNVWPQLVRSDVDHCLPGRSIKTHAMLHVAPFALLTMDIHGFFDAVPYAALVRALSFLGDATQLVVELCTWDGRLPTGAPTSPGLASAAFYDLDGFCVQHADRVNAIYSRYVDDMAFSWARPTDRACIEATVSCLAYLLRAGGYELAQEKTRTMFVGDRQEVTGLVVNWAPGLAPVRAPKSLWKRLRAGLHAMRTGRPSEDLQTLQGLTSYLAMIDPQKARPYVDELTQILEAVDGIEV